MIPVHSNSNTDSKRTPWVEPTISQLNIHDTRQNCGRGGDLEYTIGGNKFPDCTRS